MRFLLYLHIPKLSVYPSLERIQGYLDIEHEASHTKEGQPPASWPTSGDLRVENLCARYSHVSCRSSFNKLKLHNPYLKQTGPQILHNLSFHVGSGERVGVGTQASLLKYLLQIT